uniref:spermatogenesis-associated protein 22 n=1 Tax=Myxine glutinosa TaxID=7769 RepID=UPI00358FB1FE
MNFSNRGISSGLPLIPLFQNRKRSRYPVTSEPADSMPPHTSTNPNSFSHALSSSTCVNPAAPHPFVVPSPQSGPRPSFPCNLPPNFPPEWAEQGLTAPLTKNEISTFPVSHTSSYPSWPRGQAQSWGIHTRPSTLSNLHYRGKNKPQVYPPVPQPPISLSPHSSLQPKRSIDSGEVKQPCYGSHPSPLAPLVSIHSDPSVQKGNQLLKTTEGSAMKSSPSQPPLRILTISVANLTDWTRIDHGHMIFEVFGVLDSAVRDVDRMAKSFTLREGAHVVQAIFYETDRLLHRPTRGLLQRVVGSWNSTSGRLHCFSVRRASSAEQSALPQLLSFSQVVLERLRSHVPEP